NIRITSAASGASTEKRTNLKERTPPPISPKCFENQGLRLDFIVHPIDAFSAQRTATSEGAYSLLQTHPLRDDLFHDLVRSRVDRHRAYVGVVAADLELAHVAISAV